MGDMGCDELEWGGARDRIFDIERRLFQELGKMNRGKGLDFLDVTFGMLSPDLDLNGKQEQYLLDLLERLLERAEEINEKENAI
jgi:hypothetical protein